MNHKIRDAFLEVKASDALKKDTASFLAQEIGKRSKTTKFNYRRSLATVLVVLMIFFSIGGYSVWATPVSYISVDANSSVELTLNRFDRVISVASYSEDGPLVIDEVSLKGKTYTDAIDLLFDSETMRRYLTDDAELFFTVVSDQEDKLMGGIKKCKGVMKYGGTCERADYEMRESAHKNGLPLGKYNMYLLLSEYDETITLDDSRDFTMRQLRDMLKSYGSYEGSGNGNGHDNGSGEHRGNGIGN